MEVEKPRSRGDEMPERRPFRFEKLTVWQSARQLAGELYNVSKSFPREEAYGMTSQLRRAAVSMPSNIAEGSGRNSDADFAHFLEIAYGSAMEVASLLFIASDNALLPIERRDALLDRTSQVTAQINSLNKSLSVPRSKTPFPRSSGK